jgi:hypothetical protein
MQSRPSFNRSFLILIAMGVVAILGMGCTILPGQVGKPPLSSSATPSSFSSLGTGTLSLPAPFAKDDLLPTATGTGPAASPPPAETLPATSTLTETLPPPSATPTPVGIQPLSVGKYDDTDPNIAYDPHWTALKNPSTASSYKGTIHASASIGNEASFRFTGKGVRLGYQRGKSFGTVTVLIDDQPYSFNEQAFDLVWRSPQLPPGDHFVRIIHDSGESINLDSIEVLE